MKNICILIISIFVLLSCNNKPSKQEIFDTKAIEFKHKFDSINQISPYKFATKYVEVLKEVDTNGVITEDVINRTFAQAFKRGTESNMKLCAEMIKFKVNALEESNPTEDQIKLYVYKLNTDKLDKIDKLIYNTFNLSVLYFDGQVQYTDKIDNPYFMY